MIRLDTDNGIYLSKASAQYLVDGQKQTGDNITIISSYVKLLERSNYIIFNPLLSSGTWSIVSKALDMSVIRNPTILSFSFPIVACVIIWFSTDMTLCPFCPPWWFLLIILYFIRKASRWIIRYSLTTFSIVQRLFRG